MRAQLFCSVEPGWEMLTSEDLSRLGEPNTSLPLNSMPYLGLEHFFKAVC